MAGEDHPVRHPQFTGQGLTAGQQIPLTGEQQDRPLRQQGKCTQQHLLALSPGELRPIDQQKALRAKAQLLPQGQSRSGVGPVQGGEVHPHPRNVGHPAAQAVGAGIGKVPPVHGEN